MSAFNQSLLDCRFSWCPLAWDTLLIGKGLETFWQSLVPHITGLSKANSVNLLSCHV